MRASRDRRRARPSCRTSRGALRAAWQTPASAIARLAFVGTRPGHPARGLLRGHHARLQQQRPAAASLRRQRIPEPAGQVGHRLVHERRDRWLSLSHARRQRAAEHRIFPALPVAIRVVGRFFGGSSPAFLWGGTMVVLAAFFWSLVYIYRLAREFIDDEDVGAMGGAGVTATYPFALYFSALYSESFSCSVRPARSITFAVASSSKRRSGACSSG